MEAYICLALLLLACGSLLCGDFRGRRRKKRPNPAHSLSPFPVHGRLPASLLDFVPLKYFKQRGLLYIEDKFAWFLLSAHRLKEGSPTCAVGPYLLTTYCAAQRIWSASSLPTKDSLCLSIYCEYLTEQFFPDTHRF